MYVEDVINGTSNFIQVFVNDKLYDDADAENVAIPETVEMLELVGGQSGYWVKTTTDDGQVISEMIINSKICALLGIHSWIVHRLLFHYL